MNSLFKNWFFVTALMGSLNICLGIHLQVDWLFWYLSIPLGITAALTATVCARIAPIIWKQRGQRILNGPDGKVCRIQALCELNWCAATFVVSFGFLTLLAWHASTLTTSI